MIVNKLIVFLLSQIWYYTVFKSSDVAYLKPYNFNRISFILGIVCGLCFNCLFRFLKSLRKHTRFYLGLGYSKDGADHFELLARSRNPSRNKRSTSFLNISLCNFSIGYGFEHIGFALYFNSKYTWSVFQVPSVTSKILRIFVIILAIHYIVILSNYCICFP